MEEIINTNNVKVPKGGSFNSMGLDLNVVKALSRIQYKAPTPIQRLALPVALAGMDVVCMSRTGSGKTAVFLIPMVQKLKAHSKTSGVRGLVLSPSRELALQTFKFASDISVFTTLKVVSIVGGDSIDSQFNFLSNNPDIIIATPGRLMHLLQEINTFKLSHVNYLVFDEADRLFEMGVSIFIF
jgi:ATP-dependent RNA helicase DDX54/DBP10